MGKEEGSGRQKGLKGFLKDRLQSAAQKRYFRLTEKKTVSYDAWIREKEAPLYEEARLPVSEGDVRRLPFSAGAEYVNGSALLSESAALVLFTAEDGETASFAGELFADFFRKHPEADLAYGDEDVMSPEGVRYTPWLKPDWSPDTFLSGFYFGNVFAVRTGALRRLTGKEREEVRVRPGEDIRTGLYRMCFHIVERSGGFERRKEKGNAFPVGHIDEILYHSHTNTEMNVLCNRGAVVGEPVRADEAAKTHRTAGTDEAARTGRTRGKAEDMRPVSVIILSKDNPKLLKRCIQSVKRTAAMPCEIIVVDNGSTQENRAVLAAWLEEQGVRYLYESMPFHFSRLCNLGAAAAKGRVYLFLNDDVEVPEEAPAGWLEALCAQAGKPWTGAAGMKLLYPGSRRIQHAGVVNLRPGPVHKLQFMEDTVSWYYGWNRGKRNVIAVTGACLAVAAEKFAEVSGFPEELPVAFNDVDLCFSLFEKGYYNVVLQDFFLYHHESLSRGRDEETEKLERLLGEKRKLYRRHPGLYGRDPFFHRYFAGDILSSGFETGEAGEWREQTPVRAEKGKDGLLRKAREDACVMISLEFAGTLAEWTGKPQEYDGCYLQGYCFVTGSDNACYDKKILLQGEKELYTVIPETTVRRDVEQNLPDQVNVGLTGFTAVLDGTGLAPGDYRIGILIADRCSGQKLYHMTNRFLHR